MKLPETICMLPWISVETSPTGTARPCCLAREEILDDQGIPYDLHTTDLTSIYKSKYMQNLRQSFLQGDKPETCRQCWDEEASGKISKRINSRIRLKDLYDDVDWGNKEPDQLWFLDLKLGNICNLKCRICGSWSSSKWAEEEIAYIENVVDKKKTTAYTWLRKGAWPRKTEIFWKNLETLLPNIKYFEFTGGEPWLIQEHFDLLQRAVDMGVSKQIDIHYNTNGTQSVLPHVELFKKFGRVDIAFSVDNVDKRFEYERFGANWLEVNQNIDQVHSLRNTFKNITTQLCFTINIQNVFYLDELLAWADTKNFDTIYFNLLHGPEPMSIKYMTPDAKQLVLNKLTNTQWSSDFYTKEIKTIINFILSSPGSDGKDFHERMKLADQYRNQCFFDTHPEIAYAMGYR